MINSPSNVFIENNQDEDADSDTLLTLRTMRFPGLQTAAEFESVSTYELFSIRMMARVTGGPGACLAMFAYLEGEELSEVQEANIEILSRDPEN